jgi:hypothetical protein
MEQCAWSSVHGAINAWSSVQSAVGSVHETVCMEQCSVRGARSGHGAVCMEAVCMEQCAFLMHLGSSVHMEQCADSVHEAMQRNE